jgi:DNA-binding XRE family transcriptional regulator
MDMSKQTVVDVEMGRSEPRLRTILAFAAALEVEPGELLAPSASIDLGAVSSSVILPGFFSEAA